MSNHALYTRIEELETQLTHTQENIYKLITLMEVLVSEGKKTNELVARHDNQINNLGKLVKP